MLMPYTNLYIFKSFVFLAIVKCQAFALRWRIHTLQSSGKDR
jgi:hypothetical protein